METNTIARPFHRPPPPVQHSIKSAYKKNTLDGGNAEPKQINSVNCRFGLWGLPVDIGMKFYHLGKTETVVSYFVNPLNHDNSRDVADCIHKFLIVRQGSGSHFRYIEQSLTAASRFGTALHYRADVTDTEDGVGRDVAKAFFENFQAVFERIRRAIVRNLSKNIIQDSFAQINKLYGEVTKENIKQFLGNLNWDFLLDGSGFSDHVKQVIKTTLANNFPKQYPIEHPLDNDIDLDIRATVKYSSYEDRIAVAEWKATELLRIVCGESLYKGFMENETLITEANGYRFTIQPHHRIECKDAFGTKVKLCIYTHNLSVHPIDEVTIAWLNIHNDLENYFKTANIFGPDKFCRDIEKNNAHYLKKMESKQE